MHIRVTNPHSMEQVRKENEELRFLLAKKIEADLDDEINFRKKQMEDIQAIFTNIYSFVTPSPTSAEWFVLDEEYKNLSLSLHKFEECLIEEASRVMNNDKYPLETAQKLENTIQNAINSTTPFEEKINSVSEFYNFSRNAKVSAKTKATLGAVAGGLLSAVLYTGLTIALGGVAVVTSGFGLAIFAVVAVLGVVNGLDFGFDMSKNQNDSRGKEVNRDLKVWIKERNKLYQGSNKEVITNPELNLTSCAMPRKP